MKSLVMVMGLFIGLNAHAEYKAEVLLNWFKTGSTIGVDGNGKKCEVILDYSVTLGGHARLRLGLDGVELHKVPRFNSQLGSKLLKLKESASSLLIVVKSNPANSYTSPLKQTIEVAKTSKGTEVTVIEKETFVFGKTLKGKCIID